MRGQQIRKKTRRYWEDWWQDACTYAKQYGNLLINREYTTPEGYRLGRWIERQRAIYNGCGYVRGQLSGDQIRALERIGMVWKLEHHFTWEEWIREVDRYYKEHGDLMVPRAYARGDYNLGTWIAEQRNKYDKGLLTKEQLRDLDRYGMVWSVRQNRDWDDWFRDAEAYRREKGDLLIPFSYRTKEGNLLGEWIFVQRDRHAKGTLKPDRIRKLDSLGMVWDLGKVRDQKWEQMFRWVSEYLEETGRLPVWPLGIKAPDGRDMGNWIRAQRTDLGKEKLDIDRIERLRGIGIEKPMPMRRGELRINWEEAGLREM